MIKAKAVLRKHKAKDVEGYLAIRLSDGKNQSHKTLSKEIDFKIKVKYWNSKIGRVRKNDDIDYLEINRILEIAEKKYGHTVSISTKGTFTEHWKNYITQHSNTGTSVFYQKVLDKISTYKEVIKYNDIDNDFVLSLQKYLNSTLSPNTTVHYMRLFKSILNNAIALGKCAYIVHPFAKVSFSMEKKTKEVLDESDIKKLMTTRMDDGMKLFNTRNKIIFQIFSQGMRCSDLINLKWCNIMDDGYIHYTTIKNKKMLKVNISNILWTILIHRYKVVTDQYNIAVLQKNDDVIDNIVKFKYNQLTKVIKTKDTNAKLFIYAKEMIYQLAKNDDYNQLPIFDFITGHKTKNRDLLSQLDPIIKSYNTRNKNKMKADNIQLQSILYTDDRFIDDINKRILEIKRLNCTSPLIFSKALEIKNYLDYLAIHVKQSQYNKELKELQNYVGLSRRVNLTSHLSRHSYASMLQRLKVDIHSISSALGHSTIDVTQVYLRGLSDTSFKETNNAVADRFNEWI